MRAKRFGLFALSVFALIFLTSLTSAALSFAPSPLNQTFTEGQTSITINFNLTNIGANQSLTWTTSSSTVGTWTLPTQANINTSQTVPLSATLSGIPSNFVGTITGNISVNDGNSPNAVLATFPVRLTSSTPPEVLTCATIGNAGNLAVRRIDFTNNGINSSFSLFGQSNKWFPLENIQTQIEVKNNGNQDITNIEVDWGLWDNLKNQWVIRPTSENTFSLNHGNTRTLTVSFNIDKSLDVDLSSLRNGDHYKLYATATGNINNASLTNTQTCALYSKGASIVIESDFAILKNLNVPSLVQCGSAQQITSEVWNIGSSDQNNVSVSIYDKGNKFVNQRVIVGDINSFGKKPLSLTFNVPKSTDEGTYYLIFDVRKQDGNIFQNNFNSALSEFTIPFTVQGGCSLQSQVSLTASIASGGQAGSPLVVKTTITNTGTNTRTYSVGTEGFETWASKASVDQNLITLNAGQSKDVLITFNVNKDASAGSQTFSVDLASNGQTLTQPVSVQITSPPGFLGITGNVISGNGLLWGLAVLILILIVVIIVVAVRVARK